MDGASDEPKTSSGQFSIGNGQKRPPRRICLANNQYLESVVIVLIVVSVLAITGENLIRFDLIAVPDHESRSPGASDNATNFKYSLRSNHTSQMSQETVVINGDVMDTLENVFHYASFGIAVVFCLEILLKLITNWLEMLFDAWQIFDIVVVLLALSAELVSHFVALPYKPLYCIKYIVLLRLWRVPFVCRMQAKLERDSLEQELVVYRHGQQKAEEKCIQLEETLSQQTEIIKQLEGALQTVTYEREVTSYELNPIELLQSTKPSPMPRKTIPGASQLKHSFLRRKTKGEPVDIMETEFVSGTDKLGAHITRRTSYNDRDGSDKEPSAPSPDQGFVSDAVDGEDAFVEDIEDNVLDTSEFQLQRPKHKTREATILAAVVGLKSSSSPRRKMRRSSTSEYLDYARLSSSSIAGQGSIEETPDFYHNSNSALNLNSNSDSKASRDIDMPSGGVESNLPNGLNSHSSSSASDTSKPCDSNVHDRLRHPDTWSHSGISEDSSVNGDGSKVDTDKSHRHKSKTVRRFSSCPEYAYTQRMTITSDESAFLGADDVSSDEMSIHDNHGYVVTEAEALHCLAEFDGTKTYRSEEGIPMTSL